MNNCQTCKHRRHGICLKYKTRLKLAMVEGMEIVFIRVCEW